MKIYVVMVDYNGNMRSSCDSPKIAFKTKEEAENYIKENTKTNTYTHPLLGLTSSTTICNGYYAEIKEVDLHD